MSAPEPGLPPQRAATNNPLIHAMQLSYTVDGTAVYKPVMGDSTLPYAARPAGNSNGAVVSGEGINVNMGIGGGGGGSGVSGEQVKKRRGRPRKHGDGSMPVPVNSAPPVIGGFLAPQHSPPIDQHHHQQQQTPQLQQQQQPAVQEGGALGSPVKRRGRPPGSSNKKQQQQKPKHHQQQQLDALGSPGIGFTPHVITVNTGEDVSSKIMSFSQNGPRAICILSANGTIQSVTLRQAATSGGSVTYEGRFELLSLSGSFMLSENGGGRNRTGSLSVSLAGPDGQVVGGGVAGVLTAASPVQVIVGSFIADGRKELKTPNQGGPLFTPSRHNSVTGLPGPSSPLSRGTLSESSGGPGSPLHQSVAAVNSTPQGMSNLPWK